MALKATKQISDQLYQTRHLSYYYSTTKIKKNDFVWEPYCNYIQLEWTSSVNQVNEYMTE